MPADIKPTGEYPDLDSFHRAGHRTTADRMVEAINSIGADQRRIAERAAELEHERKLAEIRNGTVRPSRQRQLKATSLRFPRSEFSRAIFAGLTATPKASDRELLIQIDENCTVALLKTWKKNDSDRSFEEAYIDPDRRGKIEVAISKVRRKMRKRGLL